MRVYILVVIPQRQLSVLAVKAVAAEVVAAGRARAVAAPVAERSYDLVKQRIVCIHRPALSHGHMMRGVEAGSPDIADRPGKLRLSVYRIAASKGVAVVLHKP